MTIQELGILTKCPRWYELEQIIYQGQNQRNAIYRRALCIMTDGLAHKEDWPRAAEKIMRCLEEGYQDEWFELRWQKRTAIQEEILGIGRLFLWLGEQVNGTLLTHTPLSVPFQADYKGRHINEVSLCADMIWENEECVTGVLLYRRYPKPYTYLSRASEHSIYHAVELLFLMIALKRRFPGKQIQVLMAASEARKKQDGYAGFNEKRGDNVIGFTDTELELKEGMEPYELIQKVMNGAVPESCQKCVYEDICKPPTRVYLKGKISTGVKPPVKLSYSENQKKGIYHQLGPVRVSAGPGAGKTAVLVERIRWLMEKGVLPEKILAVTYTRKAAKEILERIDTEQKPAVSTLHALGFQIIRRNEGLIGKKRLVNQVDCMQMLLEILNHAPRIQGVRYQDVSSRYGLLSKLLEDFQFINRHGLMKFQEVYPDKDLRGILRIKDMYEQKFRASGCIYFEDQIRLAVEILEKYSGVRRILQETYDYIMVDEAQDLDTMQARMIQLLVKTPQNNIAVYGDADQSIYGFRGGDNRFMLDFPKLYTGTKEVWLDDNFRSSEEILKAAHTLISHGSERIPLKMKAHFAKTRPVLIQNFRSNRIGQFLHDLLAKGYSLSQIAVIARTNKDLGCMCKVIEQYNQEHPDKAILRYEKPKYYLYQDFTFQVIADLLQVYLGEMSDDKIWYRLLSALDIQPEKKEKQQTIYEDYLKRGEIYSFESEAASRYLSVGSEGSGILQAFARIYRASRFFMLPVRQAVPKAARSFCDENIDNQEVLDILDEMVRVRGIRNPQELCRYLTAVRRFQDDTRLSYTQEEDKLHLLTAHDSKGKEFPVVLIYGVDEFEKGDMQEERRLLYVAMTRAQNMLYMTEICKGKSMFLRELKDNLEILGGMDYA